MSHQIRIDELENELEQLEFERGDVEDQLTEAEEELDDLRHKVRELEGTLMDIESDISEKRAELEDLYEEMQSSEVVEEFDDPDQESLL